MVFLAKNQNAANFIKPDRFEFRGKELGEIHLEIQYDFL
jgi:hypothetical protein